MELKCPVRRCANASARAAAGGCCRYALPLSKARPQETSALSEPDFRQRGCRSARPFSCGSGFLVRSRIHYHSLARVERTSMPHDLPKAYEPGAIEPRWAEYWVREKLFHVETPRRGFGKARLHPDSAAAQRDRASAHGPHAQPDGDGHHRPLAPHARVHHAVAAGHGPRRHRDPGDGGAAIGGGGQEPPRHRAARPSSSGCGAGRSSTAAPSWSR